jgi:type I restriction enzyme M protein
LLLTECDLQAVISLPSGVFKPYSGVGTAALIFVRPLAPAMGERAGVRGELRGTATKSVWFYDLTADGYSLDDKRTPIEANDIPDVLAKWEKREEGPNSYGVLIKKIRENDWSLAAGRYKPVTVETANHDAPKKILADILAIEERITAKLNSLQVMLK